MTSFPGGFGALICATAIVSTVFVGRAAAGDDAYIFKGDTRGGQQEVGTYGTLVA